jgi:hypothetical protein
MADMGIGEIAALVGAAATTAGAVYSMTKGAPKIPAPPAPTQMPTTDAFRKRNAAALAPGVALGSGSGSLLGSGSGPSQNIGTSVLLGQ